MSSVPTIAFVTNTLQGVFSYEKLLWEGACRGAREAGVRLITFSAGFLYNGAPGQLKPNFVFDQAHGVDAFLVNTAILGTHIDKTSLENFVRSFLPKPVVSLSYEIDRVGFVGIDNEFGMRSIISHMVELGAKKVAYCSGAFSNPEARARLNAYRQVLEKAGIAYDERLVYEGNWQKESGIDAALHMIEKGIPFDAFASANDQMAIGVLETLQKRGYKIPDQVLLSGFDNDELTQHCNPQMSTVAQPVAELSRRGVHLLVDALKTGQPVGRLLIPAVPIFRASAPTAIATMACDEGGLNFKDELASFASEWGNQAPADCFAGAETLAEDLVAAVERGVVFPSQTFLDGLGKASDSQLNEVRNWGRLGQQKTLECLEGPKMKETLRFFHELNGLLARKKIDLAYEQSKIAEAVLNALVQANRELNGLSKLEGLGEVMALCFTRAGIDHCQVVVFDAGEGKTSAREVSLLDGGRAVRPRGEPFNPLDVVPGGISSLKESSWAVLPLVFEDHELGYLLYEEGKTSAFVYESLANQIASVIHNHALIAKLSVKEAAESKKARAIEELILPMIKTIEEASGQVKQQSESMVALNRSNQDTSKQLSLSESLVTTMGESLNRVMELNGTIDDLSENINVIAINAAIAAAKAGSEGRVFSVIASGIRELSEKTKTNTGQIKNHLVSLNTSSSGFFNANHQTRNLFTELNQDIKNLSQSLEFLHTAMDELTANARKVLEVMGR